LFVHALVGVSLKNKNESKSPHSQTFLQKVMHIRQPLTGVYRRSTPTPPTKRLEYTLPIYALDSNKFLFSNHSISNTCMLIFPKPTHPFWLHCFVQLTNK
jgi:hypothetical protein